MGINRDARIRRSRRLRGKRRSKVRRSKGKMVLSRPVASAVRKIAKRVAQAQDKGFFDYDLDTTSSNAMTFIDLTNLISKGDNAYNRQGDQIFMKRIFVEGVAERATADVNNQIRMIIFSFTDPDTVPTQDMFLGTEGYTDQQFWQRVPVHKELDPHFNKIKIHADYKTGRMETYSTTNHLYKDRRYIHFSRTINRQYSWDENGNPHQRLFLAHISDSAAVIHPALTVKVAMWFAR